MQVLTLRDSSWLTTLPHRVTPRPDEWFASVLLRCDEANHWAGGTTVAHLLRTSSSYPFTNRFDVIAPLRWQLEHLAQALVLPTNALVATTYQTEMERLSENRFPLFVQAQASFQFSLCPACVTETRMLTRSLLLPHLTTCQQHHLVRQQVCPCGARLTLFPRQTQPFTCSACHLDWGKLPGIKASPEQMALEQHLQLYYTFFFSLGTLDLFTNALSLIKEREEKDGQKATLLPTDMKQYWYVGRPFARNAISLGSVAYALFHWNISLYEIMSYEARKTKKR